MNFNLLIFCGVLSQEIIGIISSKNINESLDLLVRNKRVLNFEPGRDVPVRSGDFPYVANIEQNNRVHCVGSIISVLTVITSASCASDEVSAYKITAGSMYSFRGVERFVIEKKIRLGNYVGTRATDGIALFIVNEHLISRFVGTIGLHSEPMLTGIPATVAGWGCYFDPRERGTTHPRALRAITVPIMRHRDCVDSYRSLYNITDEDVCIYDEQKHCGHTDFGAPLIIDGKLAGVYIRRGLYPLHRVPEIFAVLQHNHYGQWITNNIVHRQASSSRMPLRDNVI